MTTATQIISALTECLGNKSFASIEAYGLALRRHGWWSPTKRGRGAVSMTDMDAAKLLLAVLSEGPTTLPGFFLRYANLCPFPVENDRNIYPAVRRELGLSDEAKFLDFVAALVRLYRDQQWDRLVYWSPEPEGFLDPCAFDGPEVDVRIKGPFPIGTITFFLSHQFIDRLVAEGADGDSLLGRKSFSFLDQLFDLRARAIERNDQLDTEAFDGAIAALRAETARGIGFERFFGGREIMVLAETLRAG